MFVHCFIMHPVSHVIIMNDAVYHQLTN